VRGANRNGYVIASFVCDDISELPAVNYLGNDKLLEMGCTAHVIGMGDYEMKSTGVWVLREPTVRVFDAYTKSEVDGFVSGLNTRIDDVEDEQSNQLDYIRRLVDESAKNLLEMTQTLTEITRNGVTASYDKAAGTVTLTGSHSGNDPAAIFEFYSGNAADQRILPAGVYHLSGCPSGGSTSKYRGVLTQITGGVDTGNGATFTLAEPKYAAYRILISGDCDFTGGYVFKPMICRIEDWNISEKFVPYTPTLHELYEMIRGYHS
jgi:hypothetical protein